jgi:ubiquinone/menaquinone biosynthesis C-methylase UbiE
MRERNAEKTGMIWQVGGVTNMPEFESNSFDVLIDKSTIDALLCAENSYVMTAKMLKEAQRVLKVGGHYIAVSYGNPDSRAFHLDREFLIWDRKEFVLREEKKEELEEKKEEEKVHYIYVFKIEMISKPVELGGTCKSNKFQIVRIKRG